jgi:hypothetical protein
VPTGGIPQSTVLLSPHGKSSWWCVLLGYFAPVHTESGMRPTSNFHRTAEAVEPSALDAGAAEGMYATTAFTVVCMWPEVWQNGSWSGAAEHDPSATSVRGGVVVAPDNRGHWLTLHEVNALAVGKQQCRKLQLQIAYPSIGGRPAAAARLSVGSAPAWSHKNERGYLERVQKVFEPGISAAD